MKQAMNLEFYHTAYQYFYKILGAGFYFSSPFYSKQKTNNRNTFYKTVNQKG